jgi:hypothetical protein
MQNNIEKKILEIIRAVENKPESIKNYGLLSGSAGISLFLYYAQKYMGRSVSTINWEDELNYAIDMDGIKVYLVKDVDNDNFLWLIGKYINDNEIDMFPLLKEQSKELQLEIRKVLIEKGLLKISE